MALLEAPLPRYIVVEGPIGAGKTTLVERLAARFGTHSVLEEVDGNPFLGQFYSEPARFAFQTEMFFLLGRYRQQESLTQTDLFASTTLSDYLFVKSRLFASLTLDDHELSLYDKVYHILAQQVAKPDMVIHLNAPLNVLLDRVHARGRPYERDLDPGYLERLRGLYHHFFSYYDDAPLLEVDTAEVDFSQDDSALDDLMRRIAQRWSSLRAATSPSFGF